MKKIIVLFSALILVSCNKDKTTNAGNSTQDSTITQKSDSANTLEQESAIKIGTFGFPNDIKECSCYFATSKADFENEKYIYADDASKTAYLEIDGKKVALNLLSSSNMESDDTLSKEIESDDYKISVKGKKIKGEEALLFEGTITIDKADGSTLTLPIYGECGC